MTKVIGFLITEKEVAPKIDFFNIGLKVVSLQYNNYNIYLWGIGNIKTYKINDKYSLSFPLSDNLLDRNVLISFKKNNIIVENDWLSSIPVFYNKKEKIISTISNFCIKDKIIHNEGLANFCEFGYSVFEQTMFKDVFFMRYFTKLILSKNGIEIEYKNDPVLQNSFITSDSNEDDVIEMMIDYVSDIENKISGDIVIPTSGGYDSRLLNYLVKDKTKIRSFTYGISDEQNKSIEVVNAKKISEIYGTKWKQIELHEYYKFIDKWFDIYGISTHLHGMYHIEFYHKILQNCKTNKLTLLSGIVGDAWAGNPGIINHKNTVNSYSDLIKIGFSHDLNLEPKYLLFKNNNKIKKQVFNSIGKYLRNIKIKPIFVVRTKIILISYITQLPEYFGMPVWTPFLNFDIVKKILNISDNRKINRIWQKDFFEKNGLYVEGMHLKSDKRNTLNYKTAVGENTMFEKIDVNLIKKYIYEKKLSEINQTLANTSKKNISIFEKTKNHLLFLLGAIPSIIMKRLKFENKILKNLNRYFVAIIEKGVKMTRFIMKRLKFENKILKNLHEYLVIKAIEKGLKR